MSKLTSAQKENIKTALLSGTPQKDLAKKYKVTATVICNLNKSLQPIREANNNGVMKAIKRKQREVEKSSLSDIEKRAEFETINTITKLQKANKWSEYQSKLPK